MTPGIVIAMFFVGIPLYLLMEHPFIFWLVFIPFAVFGIAYFILWLKK